MRFTRTFKLSGLALAAGIALANLGGEDGFLELVRVVGVLALVVAVPVFGVSALRHLLRGLLWRVGSRLFVSYLLIGVLPLGLVAGLFLVGSFVMRAAGCVVNYMWDRDLDRQVARTAGRPLAAG